MIDLIVSLLAAIPKAAAEIDDASKARLLVALDECKRGLSAIGPNAPTIRAAVERRLAEIKADE